MQFICRYTRVCKCAACVPHLAGLQGLWPAHAPQHVLLHRVQQQPQELVRVLLSPLTRNGEREL